MSSIDFSRPDEQKNVTSVFYGIDKGERIPDGYFSDMKNMTSSKYPCLATRAQHANMIYPDEINSPGEPVAAIEFNGELMLYCTNGMLMHGNRIVEAAGQAKELVTLGNKVFCSPAGAVIQGSLDDISYANVRLSGAFSVSFVDSAFTEIEVLSGEKPSMPVNGQYWYDSENNGLYKYGAVYSEWIAVPAIYVKIASEEVRFSEFYEGDAVKITAASADATDSFVSAVSDNYIVVEGIFGPDFIGEESELVIERAFPAIEYVCSHNNRIWGCYYDGSINEIYASKLGDPLNWYCYRGLSTDSYAVSCGEPGEFTGVSELGDTIVFFKENCIYSIYGTEPSSFQTVKTDCFGVQIGSEKSICKINGQLYYKSCHGIMRLSEGSLPVCISEELGADVWSDAIAGTDGRKYYIVMTDLKGIREMFVFDTKTEQWHKEDLPVDGFFSFMQYKNNLLCIGGLCTDIKAKPVRTKLSDAPSRDDYESAAEYQAAFMKFIAAALVGYMMIHWSDERIRQYVAGQRNVDVSEISDEELNEFISLIFDSTESFEHKLRFSYISNELTCNVQLPVVSGEYKREDEGRFHWEAITGIRGFGISEYKRLKCFEIRMKIYPGARCDVAVQYDEDGRFESIASFDTAGMTTYRMKSRLNKCDIYRLRFSGYGKVVIFSITEVYEEAENIGF